MLSVEIVTLEGLVFSQDAYEVLLPTADGQMGVLPHHMPLVNLVSAGVVSVRKRQSDPDSALLHYAISGGMAEVNDRRVRILADIAEHADDVNEAAAKEAMVRAKKLAAEAEDKKSAAEAAAEIDRAAAQLKVAELKRRHGSRRKSVPSSD